MKQDKRKWTSPAKAKSSKVNGQLGGRPVIPEKEKLRTKIEKLIVAIKELQVMLKKIIVE